MKKNLTLYLAVALAAMALLVNGLTYRYWYSDTVSGDAKLYNTIAVALLQGESTYELVDQQWDIAQVVTPFYPALVAGVYFLAGESLGNVYIFNILLFASSVVLLFLSMKTVSQNNWIALVVSLMYLFYYPLLKYNTTVLMEIPTMFFLSLSLYLLVNYFNKKMPGYLYAAIAVFTWLTLVNNRFIVLLGFLAIFLFINSLLEKENFRRTVLIPAAIILFMLAPWFIRQYIVYNQFVFFTPMWHNDVSDKLGVLNRIDAFTYVDTNIFMRPFSFGNYIKRIQKYSREGEQTEQRLNAFTEDKYNQLMAEHNPNENIYWHRVKRYFTLYFKEFTFSGPQDYRLISPSSSILKLTQILILMPLLLLAALGFYIAMIKKNKTILLFSILFIAHIILHTLVHFNFRYRLTAIPLILIIAAYAANEVFEYIKKKSSFNMADNSL